MPGILEQLQTAARLAELGVDVRSPGLAAEAERIRVFHERGSNRAMRRATVRAARRRGR